VSFACAFELLAIKKLDPIKKQINKYFFNIEFCF